MTQTFVLAPGTSISHYQVLSRLGAGGMGEVYRARDLTLERDIALKVLSPEFLTSVDRVRRFVQEARSASALNHPNIVTIHEIGQVEVPAESLSVPGNGEGGALTIHFIAMEFIEGITLRQMIHKGTELRKMLEVMSQVGDGLAKAHANGIVHRDLKPDNIMITVDGYAKIVDFGLAKLTEKTRQKGHDLTEEGVVMGTAAYMSPEQVQGLEIDQRSDIFSLGSILYEVVTGRRPFASDSSIDTMHRIVFAHPQPVLALAPDVPSDLQRVLDKCLAKNPDERYQSTKDLSVDLRAAGRALELPRAAPQQYDPAFGYDPAGMSPPQGTQYGSRSPSGGAPQVTPGSTPAMPAGAPAGSTPSQGVPRQTRTASGAVPVPVQAPAYPAPEPQRPPLEGQPIPVPRRMHTDHASAGLVSIIYRTVVVVALILAAYLWYTWPDFSKLQGRLSGTPTIDAQRDKIARAGGGEKLAWTWLAYDEIPSSLRRAVVEAVDPDFLRDTITGSDATGTLERAIKRKERPKFAGRVPGNSPITRAAITAAAISPSNPLRGVQAIAFAIGLEQALSRKQILELYLNTVQFGDYVFGVEAASQKYFGKPLRSISSQQAALLALKIADPSGVDVEHPSDAVVARQNALLETLKLGKEEPTAAAPATKKGSKSSSKEKQPSAAPAPEAPVPEPATPTPDTATPPATDTTGTQ